jgi:transposase
MVQRRRFSAESKREAVTMLDAPGVSVGQIAAELGIGAAVLKRWRRELRQESAQAFRGNGRPRDEELGLWNFKGSGQTPKIWLACNPRISRENGLITIKYCYGGVPDGFKP